MKKRFVTILAGLLATLTVFSQQWASSKEPPSISSVNHASRLSAEILAAAGLTANFSIAEYDVPNAMAVLYQGQRYVLYNPHFITLLTQATGTRWAAVSVLAHEIGHHLYPTTSGGLLATELEADQFSGYVLQKMGATLEEAQAAMKVLGTEHATETHPAADDRLSSIAKGWRQAGGAANNNRYEETTDRAEVRVNRSNSSRRESVLPNKNIAAVLKFNLDKDNEYYVTTDYNVVKFDGTRLTVIGKLSRYDSYDYPYIIYDDYGYRIYVHREGAMVNRDGRTVGSVTVRS